LLAALLALTPGLGFAAGDAPSRSGAEPPAAATGTVAIRARAQRLARSGNTAQALKLLQRALPAHPGDPALYNDLAALHAALGHLDKARDLLTKGLDTDPVYGLLHRNLTTLYSALAARAYDAALLDRSSTRRPPQLALAGLAAPPTASAAPAAVPEPPAPAAPPPPPTQAVPATLAIAAAAQSSPEPPLRVASRKSIAITLRDWAAAWSGQRVEEYLAFYGHHFAAPKRMRRTQWEAQRRARLKGPRYIRVKLDNLDVRMLARDRAVATFTQRYRSNRLRSTVTKRLTLTRKDGRWKIVKEAVAR